MSVGVVVIGRNEGERLRLCLSAVVNVATAIVYVDSGSKDESVMLARSMGVDVLDLDMSQPFTAARARNAGFAFLLERDPNLAFVHFVDGDCELFNSWLAQAVIFLEQNPAVAVVCGRLRERFPDKSIYNLLCDIEWDTLTGEAKACGGIAMVRTDAFLQVGGFLTNLIAGEEPELCVRLRNSRWKVWRLDTDMAWHDAAMTRFAQWWTRSIRSGYAFAEGTYMHGAPPERHWVREARRAWVWGLGIPLVMVTAVVMSGWLGLVLLLVYPLQVVRLALKGKRAPRENWLQAFFLMLGKFPEMLGQIKFLLGKVSSGKTALIEYK